MTHVEEVPRMLAVAKALGDVPALVNPSQELRERYRELFAAGQQRLDDFNEVRDSRHVAALVDAVDNGMPMPVARNPAKLLMARLLVTRGTWAPLAALVMSLAGVAQLGMQGYESWRAHRAEAQRVAAVQAQQRHEQQVAEDAAAAKQLHQRMVDTLVSEVVITVRTRFLQEAERLLEKPYPRTPQLAELEQQYKAWARAGHQIDAMKRANPGDWDAIKDEVHQGIVALDLAKVEGTLIGLKAKASIEAYLAGKPTMVGWDADAKEKITYLHTKIEEALAARNWKTAQDTVARAKDLTAQIEQPYSYRVVIEPGTYSVFWKQPDRRSEVKAWYVLVDAIDPLGKPVRIPIRDAENGTVVSTSRFGVGLQKHAFDRLYAEKARTGFIADRTMANKPSGTLKVTYAVDTNGLQVTTW